MHKIKLPFSLIIGFVYILFSGSLFAAESNYDMNKLETVRLQLKWFHAFQFAGYYAAKEQGYYSGEGLDVHILERDPKLDIVDQVASNQVQYGVEDTGILAQYANGTPIKALAAIFQHTPLIFISKQSSGIVSPYEMAGKRIMMFDGEEGAGADEAALRALMIDAGISRDKFTLITQTFNFQDLIDDKVDVISSYITDLPFFFKRRGIKINIINPQNYGFDFYGDILFTSQTELSEYPDRVKGFRRATIKGWQYALNHQEEMIQLIHTKYQSRLSLEHLRYEAEETRKLILPNIIPIGQIEEKRLRRLADTYANLKISKPLNDSDLAAFIYDESQSINLNRKERKWLQQHPVIRIGIDHDFAPYEWLDDNDQYVGIAADYLKLLEKRLGIRFDIIKNKKPWPDILDAAKHNELDMLSCLVKTPDRSLYLDFSPPYITSPAVIITEQTHGYVGSLQQLNGKLVAIPQAHYTQELLTKNYPNISIITTNSFKEALELVASGKVHAHVGDATAAGYIMKKEGIFNLIFAGQTEFKSEFRLGITKNNPVLLSIMKKALASITQDERNEIFNRWQDLKIIQGIRIKSIIKYAIIIVLIFALFSYWIIRLRKSESALRISENKLKAIFDAEPECVKVISADGKLLQINPAGLAIIDAEDDPSVVLGQRIGSLIIPDDRKAFMDMNERVIKGETGKLVFQIESLKGRRRWMDTHAVPLKDPASGETTVLLVTRDITDKKLADEKIWKQANFDPLTNLPNRRMFHDRLTHEIKVSNRNRCQLALLFLDLDHFKEVNDELGHHLGDILLKKAAKRISACVRESDTVSRLSGDEFTVIISKLEDKQSVERIAGKIIQSLSQPFKLADDLAYISASIGIAIFPDDATTSDSLIKNADQAMYIAKDTGRNRFSYFTKSMQNAALQRLQLLKDLHIALQEKQFQLRYQPILDFTSGKCLKVESLLRWFHPTKGEICPSEFIPLAEESGLIIEIGNWVFKESIQQLKEWQQKFTIDIQISINKSSIQFNKNNGHYDWLDLLDKYNIEGKNIVIEITESILLDTSDNITNRLLQYRDAGIQVAIDDFGTGYSALSYLNKFDIDYLKIDRSFTRNLTPGSSDMALTEAIIVMSHKLGLKVIAEGVETTEQKQLLKEAGCDYGQGYLFYKPMTATEIEKILQQSSLENNGAFISEYGTNK